ncbi:hypothetical protein KSP40_PGU008056 [Platanthera guangdongensis]|uniref:CRAL-TRIO domain-containing protein n=1 Tax=Platanthera guangdongensis TaxID=2320717 RepID=A0ABR2N165_9ASPA
MHKNSVVISSQGVNPQKTLKHMVSLKSLRLSRDHSGELLSFVIKVAALEAVRRLSKKRCPILWKFVQAFQVLSYPPLKWLQRWGPLRLIIRGAQNVSKPLLLLSIATAFSNDSDICRATGDTVDEAHPLPESVCRSPTPESLQSHESSKDIVPDNWLLQLFAVLEKQGISLPERNRAPAYQTPLDGLRQRQFENQSNTWLVHGFNEDELRRFYMVANGDLACLVSSLKKTIRWREFYHILSSTELEVWSHLVFWHGFDVMLQPYLVIRLGLACSTLSPHDRPRFAQAIVSQVDHGILNLTDDKDSQITVLMDCDGLSPFRFPMNMMRSCSTLVQDHFPNRLRTLYILRLPPVVRILTQSFIQVLRPVTRRKVRFLGENDQKFLTKVLRTVPAFLGGDCKCSRCGMLTTGNTPHIIKEISNGEPSGNVADDVFDTTDCSPTHHPFTGSCNRVLSSAILSILVLLVLITFFHGMDDPHGLSSFL